MFKILKWLFIFGIILAIVIPRLDEPVKKKETVYTAEEKLELKKLRENVEKSKKALKIKKDSFLEVLAKEKKIKDSTWNNDQQLWVLMLNDGKDRSGYADYICLLAKEHGLTHKFMINIYDAQKVLYKQEFDLMGNFYCQ